MNNADSPPVRRKRKMNWGDLKDLLFGLFIIGYAVIYGEVPAFSKFWLAVQVFFYCLDCHLMLKLLFRVCMATWGICAVVNS